MPHTEVRNKMERPGLERVTFQLLKNYYQLVRSFMLTMNSQSRAGLKTWLEHVQTDSFDVAFEVEMEIKRLSTNRWKANEDLN